MRPRQWGACWLALQLWQQLEPDSFWRAGLRPSRERTPWLKLLKLPAACRLIDPGSEGRLHRQWFDASAMDDLLEADFAPAERNTLYRCLDKLLEHKDESFKFLERRRGEPFGASFEVLSHDLTSSCFETDEDRGPDDLRQHGCATGTPQADRQGRPFSASGGGGEFVRDRRAHRQPSPAHRETPLVQG